MSDQPDELIPDPQFRRELNISEMGLWRWDRDPALIALGLPRPIYIRRRKYRSRREIEAFKRAMVQRSLQAATGEMATTT